MATRYVEVSREALESFLVSKRFERTLQGSEVVYVFNHLVDKNVKVKVYTSLRDGARLARGCGEDAIRVVTVFDNGSKSFGVGKFPKVLRTGSEQAVLDRVYSRIQDAYKRGSEFIHESRARFAR
jgi:hypothetical protein